MNPGKTLFHWQTVAGYKVFKKYTASMEEIREKYKDIEGKGVERYLG